MITFWRWYSSVSNIIGWRTIISQPWKMLCCLWNKASLSLKGLVIQWPSVDRTSIIGHASRRSYIIVMWIETSLSSITIKLFCAIKRPQLLTQFLWFKCCCFAFKSLIVFISIWPPWASLTCYIDLWTRTSLYLRVVVMTEVYFLRATWWYGHIEGMRVQPSPHIVVFVLRFHA